MKLRSKLGSLLLVCLAALNPWTALVLTSCSSLQLPPQCSDVALMNLEATYASEVLAACQGKTFDSCPERAAIEDRYRNLREEWAKCPAQHQ